MEVLRAIKSGYNKPTRIMYSSNISWAPLCEILKLLTDQGAMAVKNVGDKKQYYITDKGQDILKHYEQFTAMFIGKTASVPS